MWLVFIYIILAFFFTILYFLRLHIPLAKFRIMQGANMPCWSMTPLFLYFFYCQKVHTADEANDPFMHHLSLADVTSIQLHLLLACSATVVLVCGAIAQDGASTLSFPEFPPLFLLLLQLFN
jgi:hypothetical protein